MGASAAFPAAAPGANVDITSLKGTTTNDNAAAGKIGEVIVSNVETPGSSISSGATTNITSISLTAGDWDVWGAVGYVAASGTTIAAMAGGITETSATFPTSPNGGGSAQLVATFTPATTQIFSVGQRRVSIASTTTIYLIGNITFAVSTMTAFGFIGARRCR